MATNTGLTLPPLQSIQFIDPSSGQLTPMGLTALQKIVTAIQALQDGTVLPAYFPTPTSTSCANDGAAEAIGVKVGQLYRNGSVIQERII